MFLGYRGAVGELREQGRKRMRDGEAGKTKTAAESVRGSMLLSGCVGAFIRVRGEGKEEAACDSC